MSKTAKQRETDALLSGVILALGVVYQHDQETIAEEIVEEFGASALLRVAKQNEDCFLPNLRKTINFLRGRRTRSKTP